MLMSQGRKKASKLQSMISFSRDLTDMWLKSRKRLPFSAGVRTLPRIPALPAQKAGSREAHFTSSNQMFNVEGSLPSFPSQTATTQSGWGDPSTTLKWLRGAIHKVSQCEHLRRESEHEKWMAWSSQRRCEVGFQYTTVPSSDQGVIHHHQNIRNALPPPWHLITMWGGEKAGMEMTQNLTHPF